MRRPGGGLALLCASALDRSGAVRIGQRVAGPAPRAAWQRDDGGSLENSVEPHHHGGPDDHHLTWRDPQGGRAVRDATGEGTVTSMYWGSWDAVQLAGGCA